ncbi:MAG: (2Fe-2S)-binding protein [Actinomycetota bacterium]|nr:(2Fe-2S)-binding protein [Actinomycetota bacterium]
MSDVRYALTVNGQRRDVTTDSEMPLLWVLRDVLGLTGTKYGCGIGKCRACTVLVDGDPTKSCTTSGRSAEGKRIQTVEGLSPDLSHRLQQAWLAEQVPQCGYCQSGMLMAAAALLADNPRPSDADIDDEIKNICACGTYQRIRRGIKRAAGLPS